MEMGERLKDIIAEATLEFGDRDVDFRAGSRSFKVHKKVLEKYSPVLKAKLSDVWQSAGNILLLNEEYVESEVVRELLVWLYFMYRGKPQQCSIENAYSLCVAADYLQIPELVTSCCDKLCENITPENFYDLFELSKHLNLDDLRQACEMVLIKNPRDFLLSPQVTKWKVEDLRIFIEKLLEAEDSHRTREIILLSIALWTDSSFEVRSQELENMLELPQPETLSSDALFRFMKTKLYSKLDESHRKQYYVRSYLPPGNRSTDKLYCFSSPKVKLYKDSYYKAHCLDLSTGSEWSTMQSHPQEKLNIGLSYSRMENLAIAPVFCVSWRKKIYVLGHCEEINKYSRTRSIDTSSRYIKVFYTGTDEWFSSEKMKPLDDHSPSYRLMLAGVVLDDYIYITDKESRGEVGRSVNRYCLKTRQWQALRDMQTARSAHCLVALGGLIYAIGGELRQHERMCSPKQYPVSLPMVSHKVFGFHCYGNYFRVHQSPGPERYDPRADRWEYITPSHYHHELPAAVAHEGQIYVLSKAGFEAYSPETDRWTRLPVLNVCLRPSLVSIAGRLWLMTDSNHCPKVRLVYEFDVVKQEWTRLPDLPEGDYTDFAFVIKQ